MLRRRRPLDLASWLEDSLYGVSSSVGVERKSRSSLMVVTQANDNLRTTRLLSPKNPILPAMGARFPFEVAVGMNGRVWIKTAEGEEEAAIELIREIKGPL